MENAGPVGSPLASTGKTPVTGKCVGWLRLVGDKFEPIPERAEVVWRIFEMARSGRGANGISRTLRSEGVKTFGRAKVWHVSYVKKNLDNRAVIGEFAPASKRTGKRTFFEAIPDYYPAVVKRETFATVQQLRKARPCYQGRSGFNVFSHLAFDRANADGLRKQAPVERLALPRSRCRAAPASAV